MSSVIWRNFAVLGCVGLDNGTDVRFTEIVNDAIARRRCTGQSLAFDAY